MPEEKFKGVTSANVITELIRKKRLTYQSGNCIIAADFRAVTCTKPMTMKLRKENSGNCKGTSMARSRLIDGGSAFTLTELVVVIGVIVLLAAMLLPALAQSKLKPQAIVCLANMRQLQRGALLYASDNNDSCPANPRLAPSNGGDTSDALHRPAWVDGTMNSGFGENPAGCSTNPFYLGVNGLTGGNPVVTLIGSIGPYVKSAGAYHCPADHYIDPTYHVLRVRSYSANMEIGSGVGALPLSGYKKFLRYTDFGSPLDPSQCFEFLEEYPPGLNDGYFEYLQDGSRIEDLPALNHYRATSFSFADGHAALHMWQDAFLISYYGQQTGGMDTIWLAQHGTYKLQ